MDSMPEGEPDDQQHIEPKNQEPEEIDDQRPLSKGERLLSGGRAKNVL